MKPSAELIVFFLLSVREYFLFLADLILTMHVIEIVRRGRVMHAPG